MKNVRALCRLALPALAAATLLAGCAGSVRRYATVTSQPSGARCYVNGVYRGMTPVEMPYNWNWFYDIRLEKPGYQPFEIRERFYAPAKHWVGPDFFAEIQPFKSEENQWREYCLTPKQPL